MSTERVDISAFLRHIRPAHLSLHNLTGVAALGQQLAQRWRRDVVKLEIHA